MARKLPKKIQEAISYHYPGDKFVKRLKYSNRSCTCMAKHIHQSILEADYCNELYLLKKSGVITDYSTQYKIPLVVNGVHITNHYVDFCVLKGIDTIEYHEVKGCPTEVWKIKRRLTEALNPGIPYIVKQQKPTWRKV